MKFFTNLGSQDYVLIACFLAFIGSIILLAIIRFVFNIEGFREQLNKIITLLESSNNTKQPEKEQYDKKR